MTFNHDAIAALPTEADADAALIRALCTRRFAYALATDENASDFVALDPDTGVLPLNLIQNNVLFAYDASDETTTGDGVTCLVTSDGKRYKSETIAPPYSVLTRATTAQPVSPAPSVGDAYLIPAAATGADWAGKDNKIGIYTSAGWRFAIVPIGRFLYVKDETAFYHRNASGAWTAGVGSIVLGANSVNLTNILGAKASFTVKVENQTTNAPPASPTAPTAYIIGSSPTGAWSGNAGKLAICLVDGAFTIIAPASGDAVFDKALGNSYTFDGTAWISSAGSIVGFAHAFAASDSGSGTGTGAYSFSSSVAPTTSNAVQRYTSAQIVNYKARTAGALLKLSITTGLFLNTNGINMAMGILMDSLSAAADWQLLVTNASSQNVAADFYISASDALPHTYTFAVWNGGAGTAGATSATRIKFTIEEFAS